MEDLLQTLRDMLPLTTIIGAAIAGLAAPTITAIWAAKKANKNAEDAAKKVTEVKETLVETAADTATRLAALHTQGDEIHAMVNDQLTQAVNRFDTATREVVALKEVVRKLQAAQAAKPPAKR
jgi:hypothetical protein